MKPDAFIQEIIFLLTTHNLKITTVELDSSKKKYYSLISSFQNTFLIKVEHSRDIRIYYI